MLIAKGEVLKLSSGLRQMMIEGTLELIGHLEDDEHLNVGCADFDDLLPFERQAILVELGEEVASETGPAEFPSVWTDMALVIPQPARMKRNRGFRRLCQCQNGQGPVGACGVKTNWPCWHGPPPD